MRAIAVAALAMTVIGPAVVEAQAVKYVDQQGVTHFVGSLQQVPEQYRAVATAQSFKKRVVVTNGPDQPVSSEPAGEDPVQADEP